MALKFRRGTTAQKSGSLAFGEPYVNTTLGTLQIGLESGDVTLSAIGTGSNIAVAGISGSSLDITGNAKIDGNLTLGGQLTIGDASSDTVNVVASLSSSLIPSATNAFDLGSSDKIWRDLYISTGSIKFVEGTSVVGTFNNNTLTSILSATGSNDTKWNTLGNQTGSYAKTNVSNTFNNDQTFSGSINVTGKVIAALAISASGLNVHKADGNAKIELANSTNGRGFTIHSFDGNSFAVHGTEGLNVMRIDSGSQYHTHFFGDVNVLSGSVLAPNGITGSIAALNGVVSGSSQIISILNPLNEVSSSLIATASNHNGRLDAIEAESASYAKINSSNIFNGTQTVTGSLYVSGDLLVYGSSSLQNVSASAVSIGTNIVKLNTSTPSVRFAGLQVIDSGSTAMSSSLLWDSINNHWVYQRESGAVYGGGMLISGPRNLGALGDEVGITSNRVVMGIGGDHISSSGMWTDGNNLSVPNNLSVTGSIVANGITSNIAGNATTATTLETARLINGTSFDGSSNITIQNLVSGSSQITLAGVTGYDTNRYVDHTSVTLTAGAGLTGGGDISANRTFTIGAGSHITVNADDVAVNTLTLIPAISGTILSSITGDVTITAGGVATIAANSVILGTDTTGNYVASLVAGTGVTLSNNSGETATPTIAIGQAVGTSDNVRFGSIGVGMAASGTSGRIDAANDIVAYSSSDIRFKENIKAIENPIDKIRKISGNTYDWKAENKVEHGYEGNDVGVIAQEIEAVLPQLVQTRDNGYKAVKYDKLVALLIEGIKEQQLQIEDLKIEIKDLKKQKGL